MPLFAQSPLPPAAALWALCLFSRICSPFISLQAASLRRQQGGAAAGAPATAGGAEAVEAEASGAAWDTPAARELRAKIKSLEREARKRETVLQVIGWDGFGFANDDTPCSPTSHFFPGGRGGPENRRAVHD